MHDESLVPPYTLPPLEDAAAFRSFRDEVYGRFPESAWELSFQPAAESFEVLEGAGWVRQFRVCITTERGSLAYHLLLFSPASQEPAPHFLGLNFHGNQAVHPDPRILSAAPGLDSDSGGRRVEEIKPRGAMASRWPVEAILKAGFGVATFFCGEIDPDYDDGFQNGLHPLFYRGDQKRPERDEWGTIGAWAWALSRSLDVLRQLPSVVDPQQVAVIGHSRMGKTTLWAGLNDSRFSLVISNNSGCGGAALFRREFGERIHHINGRFPHWFCRNFHRYNHRESALPVDQHQLLGLIAPRSLYVASASEDWFADPKGEYLATRAALPLWGIPPSEKPWPEVDQPVSWGRVGYHLRPGKHDITLEDWRHYLKFAAAPGSKPS